MSYTKLDKDKYRIDIEKTINKKRYRRVKRITTKLRGKDLDIYISQIEKKLLKEIEIEAKTNIKLSEFTFEEFALYYLENADIQARTVDWYNDFLYNRTFDYFGSMKLVDISKADIDRFFKELKAVVSKLTGRPLSPKTIKHYKTVLVAIFNEAIELEIRADNPARTAKVPQQQDTLKERFYNVEEVKEIAHKLQLQGKIETLANFLLAVQTGMRPGEIQGLTWNKVDIESGKILINVSLARTKSKGVYLKSTKTEDERITTLSPYLLSVLNEHKENESIKYRSADFEDKFVFTNPTGDKISESTLRRNFKNFCERNELRYISPYGFRHTAATILAYNNIPMVNIAAKLGHTSTKTTQKYIHAIESVEETMIDILDEATNPGLKLVK